MKICHLTTVHSRYDSRIFLKELGSLRKKYKNVYLIVADGKDDEITNTGVKIIDIGKPRNRKERVLKFTKKIIQKALNINADIYHFHDPELIPVGLKLKKFGKKVIYDVHEDVPRQILSKPYLNKLLKPIISKTFEVFENWASKKFDGIITATPYIKKRFEKLNKNVIDVCNYPLKNELFIDIPWKQKKNEICYIGGISRIRGIIELIKALEYVDTVLHLAGNFESEELKEKVMNLPGWKKVKYHGFVSRKKVKKILSNVKIGVVTLHPTINYLNSLPIKMFEYMSAQIPVIASNFSLWKEIIEENSCGICVDPLNPKGIAKAINKLFKNDNLAFEMGKNARKLIETKYNWENEEEKLLKFYERIIKL